MQVQGRLVQHFGKVLRFRVVSIAETIDKVIQPIEIDFAVGKGILDLLPDMIVQVCEGQCLWLALLDDFLDRLD